MKQGGRFFPVGAVKGIDFSAHSFRHTFLRKEGQENGVEFAMQMSGHASSNYI